MKEAEDDEVVEEEDVLPLKAPSKKVSQAKKKKQAQSKQAWIGESVKVCYPPPALRVIMANAQNGILVTLKLF